MRSEFITLETSKITSPNYLPAFPNQFARVAAFRKLRGVNLTDTHYERIESERIPQRVKRLADPR
jgi:hypothetical protein